MRIMLPRLPGAIGRVATLAHDALEAAFLGRTQRRPAIVEGLGQRNGRAAEALQ
jgi:hypothetical protein